MKRLGLVFASLIAIMTLAMIAGAWLAEKGTWQPISRHITCKSIAVLAADFVNPTPHGTTTLTVLDHPHAENMPVFGSGDYIGLPTASRSGSALAITNTFGVVTSYTDRAEGSQVWTFTRGGVATTDSLEPGAVVPVDALVVDFGFPGKGCLGEP